MSKLENRRLGDYIQVLTDYHSNGSYESLKNNVELLSEKDYAIMIRTLNFERNDFTDDLIYVNQKAYEHLAKSKVFPDDILTNKIANPGSIYIMPDLEYPVTCGMNLFLIRFSTEVNQRYMYYCMKNAELYIKGLAHGTTTKTITKDDVRDIKLNIHIDIEEQSRIAEVLTTIDRKIEVNRKANALLFKMALEKYMHMFFKKKSNGRLACIIYENPKSNIQVGEAKTISGSIPFFTSGDNILRWNEPLVSGRNCFLNTGGNADVKFYVGDAAYSTDTWCVSAEEELIDYLYVLLSSIKEELNLKFFQGTGLKHLQKPLLKDRQIYIPSKGELIEFNKSVKPWLNMICDNDRETEELVALRDWLLPMFMNGQISV